MFMNHVSIPLIVDSKKILQVDTILQLLPLRARDKDCVIGLWCQARKFVIN